MQANLLAFTRIYWRLNALIGVYSLGVALRTALRSRVKLPRASSRIADYHQTPCKTIRSHTAFGK